MESNKKAGRIVGVLLLLIIAAGIPSTMLRGLSATLAGSENFLNDVFQNSMQMRISILLDMMASVLWVGIAIMLFPILKQYKSSLAFWFFGLWITYFAVIIFSNISHLSLLSLSQQFTETTIPDLGHFRTLSILKVEEYFWAHFMSIMLYSSAALVLYYYLFKTKLIPQLLSLWGIIAVSVVFVACWLNIFDYSPGMIVFGQNGLHMIMLTLWLLAKGFNPHQITSKPV